MIETLIARHQRFDMQHIISSREQDRSFIRRGNVFHAQISILVRIAR
jgi:hypothetical protein